jgi:hypothetical protein
MSRGKRVKPVRRLRKREGLHGLREGLSDFVLTTVDLTSFAGAANVIFTVNFSNDTGRASSSSSSRPTLRRRPSPSL